MARFVWRTMGHKKPDTRSKKIKQITGDMLDELRQRISYNPDTGDMVWTDNQPPEFRGVIGDQVGCYDRRGYRNVHIRETLYKVHRLAYAMIHGPILEPVGIDHINGDRTDNRICNLRLVPQGTNCENLRAPRKDNRSGYLGVFKNGSNWSAKIQVDRKPVTLGTYKTPEAAHQAYLEAKRRLHPGCTI